jgi:signal transduction histidine kinase
VLLLAVASVAASMAVFRWRLHLVRQRYAAVIAERNRIGREWHDTLVAGFSAISLQLDAALFRLSGPASETRELLEMTQKIVHHYRAEARRVIWDLRDNRPESESLVDAVSTALRQATTGKEIDSDISIMGEALPAPREVEHNLLRICQEALSNAIRHGEPRHLRVAMQYSTTELKVRIEDDGKGFNPAGMNGLNGGHFGLTVMEERARRFGGAFHLQSTPGKGTVVEAAIPIVGTRDGR